MSESKILTGAREAVAVAKGEQPAAAIWHNGFRYVPEAEIERLRAALREIAEGGEPRAHAMVYRADGVHSKHDRCQHDRAMHEDCGECVREFARQALQEDAR
jgi:hypothetical protein